MAKATSIKVKVDLDHEALRLDVHELLFLYGEWLDEQGLIRSPGESNGDNRTHDSLVLEFLDRDKR